MCDKRLYVFIEGDDDELFLNRILRPELSKKYNNFCIYPFKYAQKPNKKINQFLKTLIILKNKELAEYIFTVDIDNCNSIKDKKNLLKQAFDKLNIENVVIVIKEIESWYLAGLDNNALEKLGIRKNISNTDCINKEQFENLIPRRFSDYKTNFMIEILKHFSVKTAKKKNRSFKYFFEKYLSG